jgi:hypothetical protein
LLPNGFYLSFFAIFPSLYCLKPSIHYKVRDLQAKLAKASVGQGFLLMGGDCAESFKEFNVNKVSAWACVLVECGYGSLMRGVLNSFSNCTFECDWHFHNAFLFGIVSSEIIPRIMPRKRIEWVLSWYP